MSGDTRFDRVSAQLEQDNHLEFLEEFLGDELCIVAGSTWPEDEDLLIEHINKAPAGVKYVITPHAIKPEKIKNLQAKLRVPAVLFSEKEKQLQDYSVLIVDTVGLLTRIYSYADIAYVGGAAGETGLHNVLEPAAFGMPVVIGRNFSKFPEAAELQLAGGLFSVNDPVETDKILSRLLEDKKFRREAGSASVAYIEKNKGATNTIAEYLLKTDKNTSFLTASAALYSIPALDI